MGHVASIGGDRLSFRPRGRAFRPTGDVRANPEAGGVRSST